MYLILELKSRNNVQGNRKYLFELDSWTFAACRVEVLGNTSLPVKRLTSVIAQLQLEKVALDYHSLIVPFCWHEAQSPMFRCHA